MSPPNVEKGMKPIVADAPTPRKENRAKRYMAIICTKQNKPVCMTRGTCPLTDEISPVVTAGDP